MSKNELTVTNKTNEIATVTKTKKPIATKTNATKTNESFNRETLHKLYEKYRVNATYDTREYYSVDNGLIKKIVFSPNYKNGMFKTFVTNEIYETIENAKLPLEKTTLIKNGNSNAKYINNTIECHSLRDFEMILKTVVAHKLVRVK
jgi:hypothetical protein